MPDGSNVSEEAAGQIANMERWNRDWEVWAYARISLLEKRLADREDRCRKCQYRNQEGSGCHDEPAE